MTSPKTIFITGSSAGLGKETAKYFAQKGWNVIATMRNPKGETGLENIPNIKILQLDVTNKDQIENTISELLKTTTVDVLYNNAGYGLIGPFEAISDDQVVLQVNTNLLGMMRVARAFIPHFRARKQGVIINATSIAGHVAFPLFSGYHATKWAVEGWSESLAYELEQFGVIVKILAPGWINTDFAGRSLVTAEHPEYAAMIKNVADVFAEPRRVRNQSTALQVTEVVYRAATDGKKQLRYIVGSDAKLIFRLRRWFGHKMFIRIVNWKFLKKLF